MLHGVATLMARSLRMEANWLRAHLFRLVFVFFIYFMMLLAQVSSLTKGAPGLDFFTQMLWLNGMFITLGGISFFATAITEEKEESTIGLLMMAGISPVGLLLGKSTSRMIQAVLLLAVQFPFTLLAITLGGVMLNQVLAAYASLLAYIIMLANVALLASVVSQRSGTAMALTVLFLIAYSFLPAIGPAITSVLVSEGMLSGQGTEWLAQGLTWLSESSVWSVLFYRIPNSQFSDAIIGPQVISNLVAAVFCFLLSWLLFTSFALVEDAPTVSRGLLFRRSGKVRWLSASRAWSNPFLWKEYYFLAGGDGLLFLKFVLYGALLPILLGFHVWLQKYNNSSYSDPYADTPQLHLGIMIAAVIIEASIYASRVFHDEIRGQTMVSLLTLPRSIAEISYSKVVGCALGLVPALVWIMIDIVAFLPKGISTLGEILVNPQFWVMSLVGLVFLHLVVLLSLFVKWGALPLAFLCTMMSFQCCPLLAVGFMFAGETDELARAIVIGILWVMHAVSGFVFQMMIHARLYELGSK
ncbi:hypothetical protein GC163_19195 [bacterium]|nr:hypothetical protein [bacterium]